MIFLCFLLQKNSKNLQCHDAMSDKPLGELFGPSVYRFFHFWVRMQSLLMQLRGTECSKNYQIWPSRSGWPPPRRQRKKVFSKKWFCQKRPRSPTFLKKCAQKLKTLSLFATSWLDKLCDERREDGLCGHGVSWNLKQFFSSKNFNRSIFAAEHTRTFAAAVSWRVHWKSRAQQDQ